MKCGKATGPDDIPADLWKAKNWPAAVDWLHWLFNRIVNDGQTPADWQQSITVPIWKQKAQLLFKWHHEKTKLLHTAFLDLEKAFDCVPHSLIWYSLRKRSVPDELVHWVQLLYQCPESQVCSAAGLSQPFPITVGVHQGSALSPLLFVIVMDVITLDLQKLVLWTLLYADDVFLASDDREELQQQVQPWKDRLAHFGLRLNVQKTEYLMTDQTAMTTIAADAISLPKTTAFKYLGSMIATDGSINADAKHQVNAAWLKWRASTGVLCDKRMPERLKLKIYCAVVLTVALYGSECWPVTAAIKWRLAVMETRMLRWTAGLTQLNHVQNEDVRRRFKVTPITMKLHKQRLVWYGHTLQADDATVAKIGLHFAVPGRRPKGPPKQLWLDTLHGDLRAAGLHPDQARDGNK
uniref:Reverse transcriptase domain-containing protein n=1 Tax=Plectus sambesii TaxID=2011161 RepID=A0A914W303_9BILA